MSSDIEPLTWYSATASSQELIRAESSHAPRSPRLIPGMMLPLGVFEARVEERSTPGVGVDVEYSVCD